MSASSRLGRPIGRAAALALAGCRSGISSSAHRPTATISECAPGYDPCVPPYPPDVDCPDLAGPVSVRGADPHRLDADGDGTGCEQ